jgi:hypothetical protein
VWIQRSGELLEVVDFHGERRSGSVARGFRILDVRRQIIEKVSGEPLLSLLKKRIFDPLQMTSVYDVDSAPLPSSLDRTRETLWPHTGRPR